MQNIAKKCNGMITAKMIPKARGLISAFGAVMWLNDNVKTVIKTRRYTRGKKKKNLNFLTFIFTVTGNFSCKPMATDQYQPYRKARYNIITRGMNFMYLKYRDISGSPKFEEAIALNVSANIKNIKISWHTNGIANARRNICQCLAFKNRVIMGMLFG